MSSYVNFYLRVDNKFAPIGSYSRSSEMYQAVSQRVPYEKIVALTGADLVSIATDVGVSIKNMEKFREREKARIALIMNAQNTPLSEKLEAVDEIENNGVSSDEYIADLQYVRDTLYMFANITDEFKYGESKFENDADHCIYAGVEACGNLESVVGE